MRTCLARNVKPLSLCPADKLNALLGRYMAYVIGAARFLYELKVSLDLLPLALGADTYKSVFPCVFARTVPSSATVTKSEGSPFSSVTT